MSSEQYRTGLIAQITNGSQIVIGTASCDWSNNVAVPNTFKVARDNESTYILGSIIGASRIILSSNYTGSTGSGLSYSVQRSFSANRGYWRVLSGDFDFAEILSQDTIDKIDTDIQNLSASVNFLASNIVAQTDLDVLTASITTLKSNVVNLDASVDRNTASIVGHNSDISGLTTNVINAGASIARNTASITGHSSNIVNNNASIGTVRANTGASIDRNIASIIGHTENITRSNASIDILQSNVINLDASIGTIRALTNASIARNTASIIGHSSNIVNANASITTLLGVSNIRIQTAKTASYTLTASDLTGNQTFTNYGASRPINFRWATPISTAQNARFLVLSASPLKVSVPPTRRIRYLETLTATAGYIETDVVGRVVELESTPEEIEIVDIEGTWPYDE